MIIGICPFVCTVSSFYDFKCLSAISGGEDMKMLLPLSVTFILSFMWWVTPRGYGYSFWVTPSRELLQWWITHWILWLGSTRVILTRELLHQALLWLGYSCLISHCKEFTPTGGFSLGLTPRGLLPLGCGGILPLTIWSCFTIIQQCKNVNLVKLSASHAVKT